MSEPLPVPTARRQVLQAVTPLACERVAVTGALDRVLGRDLVVATDAPPFAGSAMDGFAVRARDGRGPLPIMGESRAGRPHDQALAGAGAIRISTGAVLPDGADAVVPVEHSIERDGEVRFQTTPTPGLNVRLAGEDMRAGTRALSAGMRLGPAELGVAVAAGAGVLQCARRPRVSIVATGDELVAPGQVPGPGQIPNSNAVTLAALALRTGAEVSSAAGSADEPKATRDALEHALAGADVALISGGVSVGPHDQVKPALAELGVRERFWRVALRPGGPVWFGTRGSTLVFGLPGNPVSAMVCFALFAAPALRALQGAEPQAPVMRARLAEPVQRHPGRTQAVRVGLSQQAGGLVATPTGPQGSHRLSSMLGADGLALIEPGEGPTGSEPVIVELI